MHRGGPGEGRSQDPSGPHRVGHDPGVRLMAFNAIELEILWKRLISVVDEAAAAFVRTFFSTLVRDGNDFAIVLTDAQGRSLAQSNMSLPGFIGCLPATVRPFLAQYPAAAMREGDVFITNDPWKGSGHIHDVTTVTPIFRKDRLVAFAAVVSHLPDIGGGAGPAAPPATQP